MNTKTQYEDGRPGDGRGGDRHKGTVVRVFARGFGFIRCGEVDPEDRGVYFHASDLRERGQFAELRLGAAVEFGVMEDEKGLRAVAVEVLQQGTGELPKVVAPRGDRPRPRGRSPQPGDQLADNYTYRARDSKDWRGKRGGRGGRG
jgi:cold shock CspA family protein